MSPIFFGSSSILLCGVAGVVKRDRLKICWLSAYEGSNPFLRIVSFLKRVSKYNYEKVCFWAQKS